MLKKQQQFYDEARFASKGDARDVMWDSRSKKLNIAIQKVPGKSGH
jgi:hypothetical protein